MPATPRPGRRPSRGGRGRGRGRGRSGGLGERMQRGGAPREAIAGEELRHRMQVETQPESPNAPPASAAHATGQAPRPASRHPSSQAATPVSGESVAREQRPPRGVVVLAIGLPGSGKTTWFKRRGVTPLSSDMLRTILFDNITEQRYQSLVFSTLRSLLRARLVAHMPWNYVDATNLSPKERKQWIQMARSLGYEVQAVFFDVPVEVCLERNRRRERMVPEDVMQRMAAKLRPPTFEEGFSKIIVVRVKSKEGAAPSGDEDDLA